MAKHSCCAGSKTCHRQWRRSPCCELRGGAAASPWISVDKHREVIDPIPTLIGELSLPSPLFDSLREAPDLTKTLHPPPLFLSKKSFLC